MLRGIKHHYSRNFRMRTLFSLIAVTVLFTGCTGYTFEPQDKAPQTEHDKMVKAQQRALAEQQNSVLNN